MYFIGFSGSNDAEAQAGGKLAKGMVLTHVNGVDQKGAVYEEVRIALGTRPCKLQFAVSEVAKGVEKKAREARKASKKKMLQTSAPVLPTEHVFRAEELMYRTSIKQKVAPADVAAADRPVLETGLWMDAALKDGATVAAACAAAGTSACTAADALLYATAQAPSSVLVIDISSLQFGRKLATGGAAVVYEGTFDSTNVAIKRCLPIPDHFDSPEGGSREEERRAMLREAEMMKALVHPNIVRLLGLTLGGPSGKHSGGGSGTSGVGIGEDTEGKNTEWESAIQRRKLASEDDEQGDEASDGSVRDVCLVLELMLNGSLRSVLDDDSASERLTLQTKLEVLRGAAQGLAYLHGNNLRLRGESTERESLPLRKAASCIIHRDVKAANVLLDENWGAKLTDFGISRLKVGQVKKTLTSFGGTVGWMAPEILRGEAKYNEAIDIYSFGMLIFETFTREVPWAALGMSQIVLAVAMRSERPTLWYTGESAERTPREKASAAVQQLMVRCWAHEPDERPDASEVVHVLGKILKELPLLEVELL
jgi:serine/threonine protein kinase